jgi:hypothetical protein
MMVKDGHRKCAKPDDAPCSLLTGADTLSPQNGWIGFMGYTGNWRGVARDDCYKDALTNTGLR